MESLGNNFVLMPIVFVRWLWFCYLFSFLSLFSSCSGLDQPSVSA